MMQTHGKKTPLFLWGGVDISPKIYNQPRLKYTQPANDQRDKEELAALDTALFEERPIIGICRGAQLLCAYNDGSLIQHSVIARPNTGKAVLTTEDGEFVAPVDHHQIMVPGGNYVLLAEEEIQHVRWTSDTEHHTEDYIPHVIYYPETNSLAVQPHPEWDKRGSSFVAWLNNVVIDYLGVKYHVF